MVRHASSGIRPEFAISRSRVLGISRSHPGGFPRSESLRDAGAGRKPGAPAQRKWGRHCCRPHSYRRVVFLEGKNLTPGVCCIARAGPASQPCRPALAPAPASSNWQCRSEDMHRPPGETATVSPLGAVRFRASDTEVSLLLSRPAGRSGCSGGPPIQILRLRSASIVRFSRVARFPDLAAVAAASKTVPKSLFPIRL